MDISVPHGRTVQQLAAGPARPSWILGEGVQSAGRGTGPASQLGKGTGPASQLGRGTGPGWGTGWGTGLGWGTGWDQLGWGTGHSPPGPESRGYTHSVAVGVARSNFLSWPHPPNRSRRGRPLPSCTLCRRCRSRGHPRICCPQPPARRSRSPARRSWRCQGSPCTRWAGRRGYRPRGRWAGRQRYSPLGQWAGR